MDAGLTNKDMSYVHIFSFEDEDKRGLLSSWSERKKPKTTPTAPSIKREYLRYRALSPVFIWTYGK